MTSMTDTCTVVYVVGHRAILAVVRKWTKNLLVEGTVDADAKLVLKAPIPSDAYRALRGQGTFVDGRPPIVQTPAQTGPTIQEDGPAGEIFVLHRHVALHGGNLARFKTALGFHARARGLRRVCAGKRRSLVITGQVDAALKGKLAPFGWFPPQELPDGEVSRGKPRRRPGRK
jgi:hypothetical protein